MAPEAPSPLAANIKLAQAEAGLKNEELARRLGVGIRLLQKWRSGETAPRYKNLVKLAVVLRRDLAWFYTAAHEDMAA